MGTVKIPAAFGADRLVYVAKNSLPPQITIHIIHFIEPTTTAKYCLFGNQCKIYLNPNLLSF